MTRINVIPVTELHNKHLMAEYRELPRVLTLSLKSYHNNVIRTLPDSYRLGTGHVLFFYDKLEYLHDRYVELYKELRKRNYNLNETIYTSILSKFIMSPPSLYNSYNPTKEAMILNRGRINERLKESGLL